MDNKAVSIFDNAPQTFLLMSICVNVQLYL